MSEEHCPDAGAVRRMLLGELAGAKAAALEEHFAQCERCLRLAEEWSEDDGLALALRAQADLPPDPDRAVADGLIERLQRQPLPAAGHPGQADKPAHDPEVTTDDSGRGNASRAEIPPEPSPSRPADRVGERIAGYEILGVLGRGGMGVVYKARQEVPERVVALKMVLSGRLNDDEVRRLRAEGEAAARLDHPGIVPVFEVGQHEGHPFFSMAYIDGKSLAYRLQKGPLPAREAAELVRAVAEAVAHAHSRGVIHRDLKPGNILIGADGRPRVSDFGLAKRVEGDSSLTTTGQILGTPSYMPPEQAQGQKEIGPVADVYALGAVLYALLVGRPPFQGATALETVRQVLEQEPVAPRRLNAAVPRDLETICLKSLRKEPGKRYESASALAEDLKRFLDGRPIEARPVSAWERALKWARRRPAQAALVGAVVLAVLGGAAGALFYGLYQEQQATAVRQRLERNRLVNERWTQGQAAETAGQFLQAKQHYDQALATLDADADPADADLRRRIVEGRERVLRKLEEEDSRRRRELELAAQREDFQKREERFGSHRDQVLFHAVSFHDQDAASDAAVVRREAPAALAALGLSTESRAEDFGAGLEQWRRLFKEQNPKELDRLASECYEVLLVWADAETASCPKVALRLLDGAAALGKAHGLATPRAFHLRRGRVLGLLGDRDGARAEEGRAAAIPMSSAIDHFQAGLESYRSGQIEQAAASCEEVLGKEGDHFWAQYLKALCNARARPPRWREAKVGLATCVARRPDSPALLLLLGAAHGELGDALRKKGETAAAQKEFAAAEAVFRRALDGANAPPLRAAVLTGRGVARIRQGRWEDARRDLLQAIDLQPRAYQGYVNLAQLYQSRGNLDEAVKALDRAIQLRRDPALYNTRALLQVKRRQPELARADFEQVIALEPAGTRSPRLAGARVALARLKHEAREYDAALADCEAALAVLPDHAEAHRQRARTLLAQGKYDQAGKALDRYLAGGTRAPVFYQARGLIHFRRGEYARAVDACTRAILLKPDALALRYRGWSYLALGSPRLARPDFDAALRLDRKDADAFCGRGLAAVQLIRPGADPEAVAREVRVATGDADEALRLASNPTLPLLLSCARVHARAAGVLGAAGDPAVDGRRASDYQERALGLLRDALELVPQAERADFWRASIRGDPALQPLRNSPGLLRLAQSYAR
jgi:tetratricopeptide (TPR) repeat protein/tRNA A-37 threonylcarbamoyl transferase component Bud32